MSYLNFSGQGGRIDSEPVILRRDSNFAGAQILDRLVRPAMAELQFECRATKSEAEHLMPETDAEDRFLSH